MVGDKIMSRRDGQELLADVYDSPGYKASEARRLLDDIDLDNDELECDDHEIINEVMEQLMYLSVIEVC